MDKTETLLSASLKEDPNLSEGCDFCKRDPEDEENWSNALIGKISISSSDGFYHVQDCYFVGDLLFIDALSEFSDEELTVEMPIKFCPHCGSKLANL